MGENKAGWSFMGYLGQKQVLESVESRNLVEAILLDDTIDRRVEERLGASREKVEFGRS